MRSSKKQRNSENIIPVKIKSKPKYQFCYVCREWFYSSFEDFLACGHYTISHVEELASKGPEYRILYLNELKPPDKPRT